METAEVREQMIFSPNAFAALGYYLFPCDGKKPLVKWRDESTTDVKKIEAWAAKYPGCNWGLDCGKSGIFVLDDDRGKNKDALPSLLRLLEGHENFLETFIVCTPSGGYHYYFTGHGRNSAGSKLGPGLDTRGDGGYVIAPCGGGYHVTNNVALLSAPTWLVDIVGQPAEKSDLPPAPFIELDTIAILQQAREYLQTVEPAIEGQGGDHHTFTVAARLKDLGVSPSAAFDFMWTHWNDRCEPPWEFTELERKVNNAYQYGANPPGAANPASVFTAYVDPTVPPARFVEYNELLSRELKINYLIEGQIETPSTGLIFGDPSAGKSFQGVSLALAVATGTTWMGKKAKQGIAVYFAGEGRQGIQRRIAAWKVYNQIPLPRDMCWVSESRIEFTASSLKSTAAELAAIEKKCGRPISLIIVDTLARHMPAAGDENSARDMGGFINACDWLRDQFGCVVAVIHHSGKSNKENSRGSSALRGAMDWEMKIEGSPSRTILWVKQKESELPDPIGFVLQDVQITDEVKSAVPLATVYDPTGGRLRDLTPQTARAFSALQFLISQSPFGAITEEEWRSEFLSSLGQNRSLGAQKTAFSRARKDLLDAKVIRYKGNMILDNTLSEVKSI